MNVSRQAWAHNTFLGFAVCVPVKLLELNFQSLQGGRFCYSKFATYFHHSGRPISRKMLIKPSFIFYHQLGIEFYLFVSHGGMKRQRVHV